VNISSMEREPILDKATVGARPRAQKTVATSGTNVNR